MAKYSLSELSHDIAIASLILIPIFIGCFFFIALNPIASDIAYRSYLSVYGSCLPSQIPDIQNSGYSIGGTFTSSNETVQIFNKQDNSGILVHENCHLEQFQEHRLYGCNHPFFYYFNEVEAYVSEYQYDHGYKPLCGHT